MAATTTATLTCVPRLTGGLAARGFGDPATHRGSAATRRYHPGRPDYLAGLPDSAMTASNLRNAPIRLIRAWRASFSYDPCLTLEV